MATELVYLKDFDVITCSATVVSTQLVEDGRAMVILDQTCFYPRGGGQDWDEGVIESDAATFTVTEVRLNEQGVVEHVGNYQSGTFTAGEQVTCAVDAARRVINTRLHSAGHLVDMAVDQLQLPWRPVKGAHYPHMSFVEYDGEVAPEEAEQLRQQIEHAANEIVTKGGSNGIRFMPVAEMHTVCRYVPENIPANKPARVVVYNGTFGVPCGGTHVADVHDIGRMTVTKVKTKKGVTKVSYAVEGIN